MKTSKQKYLNQEEYAALLKVIREQQDYMLFFLLGNLGLRVGEAVRLRKQDIDQRKCYVRIPTLKCGMHKGEKHGCLPRGRLPKVYHDMPVATLVMQMLLQYIKQFKIKTWLFPDQDKCHVPTWKAQRKFKRYARQAGLDKVYSVHALRHYKGVTAYQQLKDIRAVQLLLRHKNINSTVTYTTMDLEGKRQLIDVLPIVNGR